MGASTVHERLGKYILADGMRMVWDLDKSHGSYIYDAQTNKEYLDLFSFFASQPIAFNHPKLNTAEFKERMGHLSIHRPSLSDVYTEEFATAVETFANIAGKKDFAHYFFVEGGTLGVENALKASFDWKVRKNLEKGAGEKGSQVLHFKQAFHGRSGYTLSLTNTSDPRKHMYFPKFDWPRISTPYLKFPVTDQEIQRVQVQESLAIEEIKKALKDRNDDIAALIIEPIQAEGGDNHFRPEFLKALRTLSLENDFMLIFDEVQTGFGLTGKMWAYEHLDFTPDFIAFGKKAQIAGCAATKRIDEVACNVFKESSRINSTWGGNLLDMLRCAKYLEIMKEENLVENAKNVGDYFLQQLQGLASLTKTISNVRGKGLMLAFDLPTTKERDDINKKILKHGAMMLSCGDVSLRIRPHLDFSKDDVDTAISIFKNAIEDKS